MIPVSLLTVLHFVSLASSLVILALLAWQYLRKVRLDKARNNSREDL